VKSCGCWKVEASRKQIAINRPAINPRLTHGGTTPELLPLYRVYRRMIQRCSNPEHWVRVRTSDGKLYDVHPEDVVELHKRDPKMQVIKKD
jgi:hypothetical protein